MTGVVTVASDQQSKGQPMAKPNATQTAPRYQHPPPPSSWDLECILAMSNLLGVGYLLSVKKQ